MKSTRIAEDVLTVLSNAQTDGKSLVLVGQLERKLYQRTNQVLAVAGGRWNRQAKAHLFPGDAAEAMEQIILTGQVDLPQNFGYFPTPAPVVKMLLDRAKIEPGMTVLEPSAGRGNIVRELEQRGTQVVCVELLEDNGRALIAECQQDGGIARVVMVMDFLQMPSSPSYDRVVMNPPFAKQADLDHVTYALKFVKPGGLLVSVMAAGVLFRENRKTVAFREMVDLRGGTFERLPEDAFRESGTGVQTVILTLPC